MRDLTVASAPQGCTLSASGLAAQSERAAIVRGTVTGIERSSSGLHVRFGPDVPHEVIAELVETEQRCCSFLQIDYDEAERMLRVNAPGANLEALDTLERIFTTEL